MKILLTGDLHYNKPQFRWLEAQKENYDCFCLSGDFLDRQSGDFDHQVRWVSNWINNFNKPLFICSGNHDLDDYGECDWLEHLISPTVCIDGQTRIFNDVTFGCAPYIGADWVDFFNCDIIVTHIPPLKTATAFSKQQDWGDEDLYHALERGVISPCYILCGHVEIPAAKKVTLFGSKIVNPGARRQSSIPAYETILIYT